MLLRRAGLTASAGLSCSINLRCLVSLIGKFDFGACTEIICYLQQTDLGQMWKGGNYLSNLAKFGEKMCSLL